MDNENVENGGELLKFKPLHKHYHTIAFSAILSGAFDAKNKKLLRFNWQFKCQYFYFMMLCVPLYLIGKTVYPFVIDDNMLDAMKQVAILTAIGFCVFKVFIRVAKMKVLIGLNRRMAKQYKEANYLDEEYQKIFEKSIESNNKIEILWICICCAVVAGIVAKPVYEMLISALTTNKLERKMLFYGHIPFFDDIKMASPLYELIVVYTIFIITLLCFIYTSFDAMFMVLIVHNCANLDIVMAMLEKLFHTEDGSYNPEEINQRMKRTVMLHQDIIEFVHDLNAGYWPFVWSSFVISTILICSALFQIITSMEIGIFPYDILPLSICPVINLFLICLFGEKLITKSTDVSNAAYGCGWEAYPDTSVRKSLSLMIMRSQHPLALSSKFSTLSMASFSAVIQTAWSYFTIMRQSTTD